jgi:hypothetical protein
MKIRKPKKFESIDVFAIAYVIFTLQMMKSNIAKENLIINLFLILMYLKTRFIKFD